MELEKQGRWKRNCKELKTQKALKKREGTKETGRNYKATESTKETGRTKETWLKKKVEQQDLMVFKNPKFKIGKV